MGHLALVLFGIVSLLRMPISLLPELAFPKLVVWTVAPELGPAQVERFVTEPVEEALAGLPGVRSVRSLSGHGHSWVTVTFVWGTDMGLAQLHVRERLDDEAARLPPRAERPLVLRVDPGAEPILIISAAPAHKGWALAAVQSLAESVLRRRLEQLPGVARVELVGTVAREIRVDLDALKLSASGLDAATVASVLSRAGASSAGGTIRHEGRQHALRVQSGIASADDVAGTVVAAAPGGGTVRLSDVARVRDTLARRETAAYFNGRPTIGVLVYKESDANSVAAARDVRRALIELEREHSELRLEIVTSQARFITAAIRNVLIALLAGALLTYLVLFPFLGDWRAPTLIATAVPVSVLAAFVPLHLSGTSINIVSLGGMALGIGMLVDNAIVVLENIYRHREAGTAPAEAAVRGAEEVRGAIAASTLTTIAVFGPIAFADGVIGALLRDLAMAVAFSLLASLLVALTLIPALAARLPERALDDRRPGRIGLHRVQVGYERALDAAIDRPSAVVGWAAALLAVSVVIAGRLPRDLLPEVDEGHVSVRVATPPGTPFEQTEAVALVLDRRARADPAIAAVLTRVGRAAAAGSIGENAAGGTSAVLDIRTRSGSGAGSAAVRRLVDGAPDAAALQVAPGMATQLGAILGTGEPDLSVELRAGPLSSLEAAAEELARRLAGVPGLADVRTSFEAPAPEIRLVLDRDEIARRGVEIQRVIDEVLVHAGGRQATELRDFEARIPVVLRSDAGLPHALSSSVDGVPLRLFARAKEGQGTAVLRRHDQRRLVAVAAKVERGGLSRGIASARKAIESVPLPSGVEVSLGGGTRELDAARRSLGLAFLLALAVVYLLLAAQFESLLQPLVVLLAVPLALAGAVLTLAVAGRGLDLMSGIGMIVLVGIAVNDAIVKLDFLNRARRGGMSIRKSIHEAGRARLRPILMTSATTVLGLLPMALGLGSGAELRAPLALALGGGLTTATFLTLLVIPAIYARLESRRSP